MQTAEEFDQHLSGFFKKFKFFCGNMRIAFMGQFIADISDINGKFHCFGGQFAAERLCFFPQTVAGRTAVSHAALDLPGHGDDLSCQQEILFFRIHRSEEKDKQGY